MHIFVTTQVKALNAGAKVNFNAEKTRRGERGERGERKAKYSRKISILNRFKSNSASPAFSCLLRVGNYSAY